MTTDPISELMPLVYDELRRIAASYVRGERPGQTLQATALVNEAFVRLAAERAREFNNRTHFLAIAALSMRQILVQRARARNAIKRGGGPQRVTLDDASVANVEAAFRPPEPAHRRHRRPGARRSAVASGGARRGLASIVELRYFGGLTVEEIAEVMGTSPATVKRQWALGARVAQARARRRRQRCDGGSDVTPEQWERLKNVFQGALEQPARTRDAHGSRSTAPTT